MATLYKDLKNDKKCKPPFGKIFQALTKVTHFAYALHVFTLLPCVGRFQFFSPTWFFIWIPTSALLESQKRSKTSSINAGHFIDVLFCN